jgi:hypothetical protein
MDSRDFSILAVGSDHPYECRCEICLEWWRLCGEDGDEPGNYGPFSEEEIQSAGGLR